MKTWTELSLIPYPGLLPHDIFMIMLSSSKNRISLFCVPAKCLDSEVKGGVKFRRGAFSMMEAVGKIQGEARKKGHPACKSSWRRRGISLALETVSGCPGREE